MSITSVTPPDGLSPSQLHAALSNLRLSTQSDEQLALTLKGLKQFQNKRLACTHQDLLEDESTRSASLFFLEELYADRDFTLRDQQVGRVLPKLEKYLPNAMAHVVGEVIAMDYLAEQMDVSMALFIKGIGGIDDNLLDVRTYLQAYRALGHHELRRRQVHMVKAVGRSLVKLMRVPMLGALLKMTEGKAHRAGLGEFHQFLAKGVAAFRTLDDPERYFTTLVDREMAIHEAIVSGAEHPFGLWIGTK